MKTTRVTIKKGTRIYSTVPGWPSDGKPAGRTYMVEAELQRDRIVWIGASSYWKWVKVSEVFPT